MVVFIDSVGRILSQCIFVPNHHIVHFTYLTVLFASYTPIKVKKKSFYSRDCYED